MSLRISPVEDVKRGSMKKTAAANGMPIPPATRHFTCSNGIITLKNQPINTNQKPKFVQEQNICHDQKSNPSSLRSDSIAFTLTTLPYRNGCLADQLIIKINIHIHYSKCKIAKNQKNFLKFLSGNYSRQRRLEGDHHEFQKGLPLRHSLTKQIQQVLQLVNSFKCPFTYLQMKWLRRNKLQISTGRSRS